LRAPAERELLAGRYEILSLLGSGGMAEVFAGRDRMLERMVAIKRPRRDTGVDAQISERLQREAIALASIDSPNVVAIHDVGATEHGVYLVMQRLFGRTLYEEIRAHGPMSGARACRIARDILAGLTAIHASGLVHRDLKASNVLLDRREMGGGDPDGSATGAGGGAPRGIDGSDRAVLLDLGAALHLRRRSLTAPGTLLGTPECMAPEQLAQGAGPGRRALRVGRRDAQRARSGARRVRARADRAGVLRPTYLALARVHPTAMTRVPPGEPRGPAQASF